MKESWKPGTLIYPLPAVLVSCGATPEEYNLLTVAVDGHGMHQPADVLHFGTPQNATPTNNPPHGGVRHQPLDPRPGPRADWCGVRSGRDYDKFREMGLTPGKALQVTAPIVEEAPVSIECRVRQVMPLGSHDMFLAEVVAVQVDAAYIDPATGRFCLERACPIVYSHGEYFALGEAIGHFGWSVRRKPRRTAGAAPAVPASAAGNIPACGSFRSTRGRPREREARRKTCPCAKTRSSCRPPLSPQTRREEAAALMPGAGLSGDRGTRNRSGHRCLWPGRCRL